MSRARSLVLAPACLLGCLLAAAPALAGPPPPAGWTDGYVSANGIRLHYWRTGGAKPALVMAHGSSDDALCWTNLARELTDRYDVIMFDARGHGLSDPPTAADPVDVQVEDLAGLIKALKLDKPILMGHSMGSASVAWFAAKYPDVPRAVILEDPALVRPATPAAPAGARRAHRRRAARHHPQAQQPQRSRARRRLHEELAEVGPGGVRDLGAVQAAAPSRHRARQQRAASADARAAAEDRRADADPEGRRAGRPARAERGSRASSCRRGASCTSPAPATTSGARTRRRRSRS